MDRTVSFHTLGCKLNFAETSAIGRQLRDAGFKKIPFEDGAEVVVINTCSVTENAARECKTIVRRALQKNPDSFVAVIGCYAQLKPDEIAKIDGVDLVLGATEKFNLPSYLSDNTKKNIAEIYSCTIGDANHFNPAYSFGDRTRAFLKVQDGCNYPCTYCTIPLARGSSRSAEIDAVIRQVEELALKGAKEIVLTGVNLGDFGITNAESGKHKTDFLSLVKELDQVEGIERFRISSIEPNLLSTEIISFVAASQKFAPHFHIPLQSGSDKILRLMKRRYNSALYSDRVRTIKELLPNACIGADVITGFPGEDEYDFLDTYRFINELDLSYLHVFTYSERENTEALLLSNSVPFSVRKKRTGMLRILSEKKLQAFYRSQVNQEMKVIFEKQTEENFRSGYTENYVRVRVSYPADYKQLSAAVSYDSYEGGSVVNASMCELTV